MLHDTTVPCRWCPWWAPGERRRKARKPSLLELQEEERERRKEVTTLLSVTLSCIPRPQQCLVVAVHTAAAVEDREWTKVTLSNTYVFLPAALDAVFDRNGLISPPSEYFDPVDYA